MVGIAGCQYLLLYNFDVSALCRGPNDYATHMTRRNCLNEQIAGLYQSLLTNIQWQQHTYFLLIAPVYELPGE